MKSLIKILTVSALLVAVFFSGTPSFSFAQTTPPANNPSYQPLVNFPGQTQGSGVLINQTGLSDYLRLIFTYMIGIAIVLTVIMVILGGMQYATTDAVGGKSQGKKRIETAIEGLVFTLLAWLILNTLNPNFVKLKLNLGFATTDTSTAPSTPPGGTGATGTGGGLTVRPVQPCVGCVDIQGIPSKPPGHAPSGFGCDSALSPTCKMNSGVLQKLVQLNQTLSGQGINIIVNEAWPPTVDHQSACHYNGGCVDVGINSANAYSLTNVQAFCTAAQQAGIPALFESMNTQYNTNNVAPCTLKRSGISHFHLPR